MTAVPGAGNTPDLFSASASPAITTLTIPDGPQIELLCAGGLGDQELRTLARRRSLLGGFPYRSRSYRFPYALVARHQVRVGVDIERVAPCDRAFAESICTPGERKMLGSVSDRDVTSIWASKEALAKALGDARRYDPGRLCSPRQWRGDTAGRWRALELAAPAGYCAWICWWSLAQEAPA